MIGNSLRPIRVVAIGVGEIGVVSGVSRLVDPRKQIARDDDVVEDLCVAAKGIGISLRGSHRVGQIG